MSAASTEELSTAILSKLTLVLACTAAAVGAMFAATVPAHADSYVYATGSTDGSDGVVFQYGLDRGFAPLGEPTAPTDPSAWDIAVHPNGQYVYATSSSGVSQYDVQRGLLLRKTPGSVLAGGQPQGLAMSRDGTRLYVASQPGTGGQPNVGPYGAITQYRVDPDNGALSVLNNFILAPAPGMTDPALPVDVAVSSDGKSLYVANFGRSIGGSNVVYQLDVQGDGTISYKSQGMAVTVGDFAASMAVSSDGKTVYVANSLSNTISQLSVDPNTGALTAGSTVGAGNAPVEIALSPDGGAAYVANAGAGPNAIDSSVGQYTISRNGSLTPMFTPSVTAGTEPFGLAISADGHSLFVADRGARSGAGALFEFDIDARGALSSTPSATQPAGQGAVRVAVNPPPVPATSGPDRLSGTAGDDVICGYGGGDRINGKGGDDSLSGDSCGGGASASVAGFRRGGGHDVLRGGAGHDVLRGGNGNDRLGGGRGRDWLHGGAGKDTLRSGAGKDVLHVRGGGRDRIHCGDGRDTVRADRNDVLRSCERILRR